MEFTFEKFNELKHEAEEFYNKIGQVYCPYFKEKISFNSKGWDHLIFKSWNRTRPIDDQYSRLRHLKIAPTVISDSKTLQGCWPTQKIDGGEKFFLSIIPFWGLNKKGERVMHSGDPEKD